MEYITNLTTRGRVTIPKEMRATLRWHPSDRILFTMKEGEVTLEKVAPAPHDSADNLRVRSSDRLPDIRRLEP